MAVVDVNYKFTMTDVGSFGKNSDGGILEHSNFGKLLYGNTMDLPEDKELNECENHAMPFVFVGDEAFRLSKHLINQFNCKIEPTKVDRTIKAACVLHNFIRIEENRILQTQLAENVRPDAFLPMQAKRLNTNQSSREAREIRDRFCHYFNGVGAVDWQDAGIYM
ncbi:hypothetical protein HUJ04_000409 [Dendroctonus ponderosae]|nr:hypothetical protein HUJ04_000409 [Dendroctonus ponderosae]KAH1019137.1 hypothetical protein HUJ05_006784 [Dendroctonus ponderosae]